MNLKDFDYYLPEELIADEPLQRGESRLMVLNREKRTVEHRKFTDVIEYIDDLSTVVFNASRVIPARLFGKKPSGGAVEILLIKKRDENIWEVMAKSSKPLKEGDKIILEGNQLVTIRNKEDNIYLATFAMSSTELLEYLEIYGDIPLPPYILKKRGEKTSRPSDRLRYQTVYASSSGSIAAPTAGLHFTEQLIEKIKEKTDDRIEFVFLDVGLGTFLPVKTENIKEHIMHKEHYFIPEETAVRLNIDKKSGRKIVAVGTTSVRTLETAVNSEGLLESGTGTSQIFIYPGYDFKFADRIITNFHLPCSTLIMMISAFAGHEFIMEAYKEAVKEKYRFYSYGDAMIIL